MTYERLTSIPLFTGISGDDLAIIMDRVELIDVDLRAGEMFVSSGDVCQCMAILRSGEIERIRHHDEGVFKNGRRQEIALDYKVTELLHAPLIIEPEVLFGLDQRHKNSWRAHTSCQLTLIGKDDIRKTLMYAPVWRINFINMLCTNLQRSLHSNLPLTTCNTYLATIDHLLRHCSVNGTSITFDITMEQLGYRLGMTRTTITKVIDKLVMDRLIERQKNQIHIPSIALLTQRMEGTNN